MSSIPEPKKKPLLKKRWFWAIIILILIIAAAVQNGQKSWQKKRLDRYHYLQESIKVTERTLRKTVTATGTLAPEHVLNQKAGISGTVEKIFFAVGDYVNKDQIILEINGNDVKAAFDGTLVSLTTFEEDVVVIGSPLFELGYRSSVVEFLAADSEIVDMEKGQAVTMHIPAYNRGRDQFSGELIFVDTQKRTDNQAAGSGAETGFLVQISTGDIPKKIRQLFGLNVDIEVEIAEKSDVPSLEPGAVQRDDDQQAFVYLVPELNEQFLTDAEKSDDMSELLTRKYVETGFEGDEYIEITKGLEKGDKVLLYIPTNTQR